MPKMIEYVDGQKVVREMTQAEIDARASVPVPFLPLEPWQFHAVLDLNDLTTTVEKFIDTHPDPVFKAKSKAILKHSKNFERDDQLLNQLAVALGITDAEVDQMWRQGEAL